MGIYGGSFDPPHLGHLNLAQEIFEKRKLREIWFCPANCNPHKPANLGDSELPTPAQRLEMLRLSLELFPHFRIINNELDRPPPSYTFDTIQELMAQFPDQRFALILGDDVFPAIGNWHRIEELVQLLPFYIGSRHGVLPPLKGSNALFQAVQKGLTETRRMEISSTEVRNRLKKQQTVAHLLPSKVVDYIAKFELYS